MRLWSFHPKYLDARGLGGVWREGLLAQKVLEGQTTEYKNHSALERFKTQDYPLLALSRYLEEIWHEASARGYNYNELLVKMFLYFPAIEMPVTSGQLRYEWGFYLGKIKTRSPELYEKYKSIKLPKSHPMFYITEGDIENWERAKK